MSEYIALASALAYLPSPSITSLYDMPFNSPLLPSNRRPTAITANLAHAIIQACVYTGPRRLSLTVLKFCFVLVFALNLKSFPFIFHLRLSRPVFRITLRDWFHALRVKLSRRDVGRSLEDRWLDTVPLVGTNPFEYRDTFRTRATLDECDYNVHLSNSSYAKVLDIARFETVVRLFPVLFRSGAGMALGGSHFHFIREIPALQEFEIRTSIGTWDNKWSLHPSAPWSDTTLPFLIQLYMVSKFVSKPSLSRKVTLSVAQRSRAPSQSIREARWASTKCEPTPLPSPPFSSSSSSRSLSSMSSRSRSPSSTASTSSTPSLFYEPDDSLVHTVVIAQLCFKAGRITIPPSVVLASNGFCSPSNSVGAAESDPPSASRSPTTPPHWEQFKTIASPLYGGSLSDLYEFYRGGWRDVPERDRWWDRALDGYVEIHRATAATELARLRDGLECARSL
ncbi:hypothetical protein NMY22_g9134 [Coprinellus aureogranulatus]|nr:hypothetical protein NMY22_g9134 [Coprinellus aureogranulatus]